jgi:omega-amidase
MEKFRAGVAQFDIVNGDIEANVATAMGHLGVLAGQGVDLAVLPEMFSTGFDNGQIKSLAARTPKTLARFADFARDRNMAVAGSFPEADKDDVYNTLYFIDRDGLVKAAYRKLHLFRLTDEHRYYTPGDQIVAVETSLGPMGLMICYDLRFPELARQLAFSGARTLIVSAQWPSARAEHWTTLIRARAIENQVYVIASNRTGNDGDLAFPGLSAVIDPLGTAAADAGSVSGTAAAGIDPGQVDMVRKQIPVMTDRREDIYG